uniref:Uncharacterized protein n=1 Tax=Ditylenchus dipsaci TaxID=166011 RepID=A0A915DJK5_9BILA
MLRHQNVQQLRSLITELTMGHDVMKIRRRNLRAATNTLLFIISAYLISNLLNLFLSVMEYLYPGLLQRTYPYQYRICSDCASLMTVLGNALRFPAHICSNKEISEQLQLMLCASDKEIENLPNSAVTTALTLRRFSERVDNPCHKGMTNGLSFQHILPLNRDDITTKYLPKSRSFFHTPDWFVGKGNTTLDCDCPNPEEYWEVAGLWTRKTMYCC